MNRRTFLAMLLILIFAAAALAATRRVEAFDESVDAAFAERKHAECEDKKKEILKEIEDIKADRDKTMKRPSEIAKQYQDTVQKTELLKKEIDKMKAETEALQRAIPDLETTRDRVSEYKNKLMNYVSSACI